MTEELSQSLEDYLEEILWLSENGNVARVRDIAAKMAVSMPSVNGALKRLETLGLVSHGKYDYVELTTLGKRRAGRIASKHELIQRFLTDVLKLDPKIAANDACAIEHCISPATVDALCKFTDNWKDR